MTPTVFVRKVDPADKIAMAPLFSFIEGLGYAPVEGADSPTLPSADLLRETYLALADDPAPERLFDYAPTAGAAQPRAAMAAWPRTRRS